MADDEVAVTREVRRVAHEGEAAVAVVVSRSLEAPAEAVWAALTDPDRLRRWFRPVEGDLAPGGRYRIQDNASGTITRCAPPRELAVTWEFGGDVSWLEVRLSPDGDGTQLELRHVARSGPHGSTYGPAAVGVGWDLTLLGLGLYLADPSVERLSQSDPAWMASPEALAFVRASSEGWGAAAIAAGEDPSWAREAAERTRRFYSGEG